MRSRKHMVLFLLLAGGLFPPSALLAEDAADPRLSSGREATKLVRAAADEDSKALLALLDAGADIHAKSAREETPLQAAAAAGATENVKLLLARGARVDELAARGATALGWAARNGRLEAAVLLLEAGANPDAGSAPERTPLALATAHGQEKAARLLVDRGSKALTDPATTRAVVQGLSESFSLELTDYLLPLVAGRADSPDYGAILADAIANTPSPLSDRMFAALGPAAQSKTLMTMLLLRAANRGRPELVKLALERGADPNASEEKLGQPLAIAVARGDAGIAQILISAGADEKAAGVDSLKLAALSGNSMADRRALEAIEKSGNVDMLDGDGKTLLFRAAARGDSSLVATLLERGAKPAATVERWPGDSGWTPLMAAAAAGHAEVVKQLLRAGAPVDDRNGLGRTALSWAAFYGRAKALLELLGAGADPLAADAKGLTPFTLAQHSGDAETLALLRRGAAARGQKAPPERRP